MKGKYSIESFIKEAWKLREERGNGGAVQNFGRYGGACIPEFYEVLLDTLSEDEESIVTGVSIFILSKYE